MRRATRRICSFWPVNSCPSSHSNRPVELADVIEGRVSEIEEYERIMLNAQPGIAAGAPAVSDVVHILAELIENATALSPSSTSPWYHRIG